MPFRFNWTSFKGRASAANQDYAGLTVGQTHAVAVIVDGVSARPSSGIVARELSRRFIDKAYEATAVPTEHDALRWLRATHDEIRSLRLGSGAAAYLIACFDHGSLVFTVHAGDCRFGLVQGAGLVDWRTPIHSLATALGPVEERLLTHAAGRNQLTRSFATRRFCEPELQQWHLSIADSAVLGTDGFWAAITPTAQAQACRQQGQAQLRADEDSSMLLASPANAFSIERNGDDENLYVRLK